MSKSSRKSTFSVTRYKSGGNDDVISDINITYGFAETKFGECLLALQENTVCFMSFVGPDLPGIEALKTIFPKANLTMNNSLIATKLKQLFEDSSQGGHIDLLLKGTDFEVRVWKHLVNLPRGSTTTYEDLAKTIGHPKAVRAVARALAKNNISYFVPCHRVIAKKGTGGYKWGVQRKKQMLNDEKKVAMQTILDKFWKKVKNVPDKQTTKKSEAEEIQN